MSTTRLYACLEGVPMVPQLRVCHVNVMQSICRRVVRNECIGAQHRLGVQKGLDITGLAHETMGSQQTSVEVLGQIVIRPQVPAVDESLLQDLKVIKGVLMVDEGFDDVMDDCLDNAH